MAVWHGTVLGFSLNNLISFLLALFHLIEHKQDKAPCFIKTPFYFPRTGLYTLHNNIPRLVDFGCSDQAFLIIISLHCTTLYNDKFMAARYNYFVSS